MLSVVASDIDGSPGAIPDAAEPGTDLDAALGDAVARGQAAWPAIAVPPTVFRAHVRRHLDDTVPATPQVAALNCAELWLACGGGLGLRAATEALVAAHQAAMVAAVQRLEFDDAAARDVVQDVLAHLLTSSPGQAPRILDYGGHGSLRTWLRVIALRAGIDVRRKVRHAVEFDDDVLLGLAVPDVPADVALDRRALVATLKQSLHAALAALTPRQRTLLRQQLLDGLTIDDLGALYRVHRVTAARWLVTARETLWRATVRGLRAATQLSATQVDWFITDARSALDLSLERVLGASEAPHS